MLLLVEPEPDLLIETADQYLEFASKTLVAVPRPELRHRPLVLRQGRPAGHDPPARQATSATSTWKTSPPRGCTTTSFPGEGAIDFAATLAALKEIGYDGWVTIELYTCHENPDLAAKTARERIMTIANQVGVHSDSGRCGRFGPLSSADSMRMRWNAPKLARFRPKCAPNRPLLTTLNRVFPW